MCTQLPQQFTPTIFVNCKQTVVYLLNLLFDCFFDIFLKQIVEKKFYLCE